MNLRVKIAGMEVILATGNWHKTEELGKILAPHKTVMPERFSARETGSDYLTNALIKARALAGTGGAVLADDSGLSVPALGGAPGVYSARYGSEPGGPLLDPADQNKLLLSNMAHLSGTERRAFFVCCMVLMINDYRFFSVQETFEGSIADKPCGTGGFGYDPIFIASGKNCTVAEISSDEKAKISHRGKAGQHIRSILDNLDRM